jgi:hypothetical protein
MESFVANHYTAKAYFVLAFSIWGFGFIINNLRSFSKHKFIQQLSRGFAVPTAS